VRSGPLARVSPYASIGVALLTAVCWTGQPVDARAAQSSSALQQASTYVDRPPAALTEVRDAATQIFDAALLSHWPDADVAARSITNAALELPTVWSTPDLGARLVQRIAEVAEAVSARQLVRTLDLANGITRLAADLSSGDQTPIPYALALLDFYGRELELGIAAGDQNRLTRATADLQQTWNRFELTVLQHGAIDDARLVTDSVAQLVGARVPADFVEPTRAELTAVDSLKRLFKP
jgi:hypothetical protein